MEIQINTPEEALKAIEENAVFKNGNIDYVALKKIFDVAISSLKKDIATHPDIEGDGYADGHIVYDTWICPTCRRDYEMECQKYERCPHCGQLIDWDIPELEDEDE